MPHLFLELGYGIHSLLHDVVLKYCEKLIRIPCEVTTCQSLWRSSVQKHTFACLTYQNSNFLEVDLINYRRFPNSKLNKMDLSFACLQVQSLMCNRCTYLAYLQKLAQRLDVL